jgi:hypothetical protein
MQEMPSDTGPSTGHVPTHPVDHTSRGIPTGDAAVDDALRTLDGLENRPIHEHAAIVEGVHHALQERLADEPADDEPSDGQV